MKVSPCLKSLVGEKGVEFWNLSDLEWFWMLSVYIYIYTYTLIDFHQIGFPGATFWGVEVTQDRPKRRKLASGLRRRSERFTSATSGEKNWKFLKNFSRSKMQAGRSYFCDGSNSFFFSIFFSVIWRIGLREGGDDRIPLFLDVF